MSRGAAVLQARCLCVSTPAMSAPPTFREALRFWLKLGFISFGGPTGQIAVMHTELVENKKWIGEQHFLHASADVEPRAQCNRQPGLASRGRRVVAAGGLLTCSTDGQAHSDESAAPGRTERLARFDGESAVVSHSCLIEGLSHREASSDEARKSLISGGLEFGWEAGIRNLTAGSL